MLRRTLASLQACRYPRLEVLVVDNHSSDGSESFVPAGASLLPLPRNFGYAGALNRAIERLREESEEGPPDYLLVLNNDLELDPLLVDRLVDFAQQQGPGVFGPQVRRRESPDRLDAGWGKLVWSHVLARYCGRGALAAAEPWTSTRRVELLLGCALLMNWEVAERVGPWDERFFMYHEEVDFLLRAGRLGYPVHYCPFTWVLHQGGHSTRGEPLRKVYWLRRNTVYFFFKHRAGGRQWLHFSATLGGSLAFNLVTLRWRRLAAICRGVRDGFRDGDPA